MNGDKSRVMVIPCSDYDEDRVYSCVSRGIQELGGIEKFVSKDEKILVKPNFLSPAEADKAIVTHPSVLKAVLRLLDESGYANVKYGDSPGHGTSEAAAKAIGINDATSYHATLAPMSEETLVEFPEGDTCREFYFTTDVAEADAIINVCKMKTHALERITGAVKNVYGLICGYWKAAGHVKYPNDTIFARMLCDIHRCVKPRLHIMDGIVAMEGNGPSGGSPVDMKVLLISEDPVALDTVFCYLVNLNPELVPTNSQGCRMGIGTDIEEEIEINLLDDAGVSIISREELYERYGNGDFDVARAKPKGNLLLNFSGIMTRIARRPVIDKKECIKCGICVSHCPVPGKAVDFRNGKDQPPVYDYSKCIRCYCCQEMCPKHAISAHKGLL